VSIVVPNISIKLVLVLPVASLVSVMVKAPSEEARCHLVEMVKDTETLDNGTKLTNVEMCVCW
jgi:hypothetical protein